MNLTEIIKAIDDGKKVYWNNKAYKVVKDKNNEYLIKCISNGHCIGLTWADGKTLNAKENEFFTN